jgi:hypothetical protein
MRVGWLLSSLLLLGSTGASAEPLRLSLNLTTGSRWLEGVKLSSGRTAVQLEGNELAMGGTVDLSKRLGFFRVGGQLGADVLLFPKALEVRRSGPLVTSEVSSDAVSSLLVFSAAPFAGLVTGEPDDFFLGWVDLLVALELTTARVGQERHFALAPVPTLRLGGMMRLGDRGGGLEVSLLASYFGAPRVALALGARF